jgi:hypothetical protein
MLLPPGVVSLLTTALGRSVPPSLLLMLAASAWRALMLRARDMECARPPVPAPDWEPARALRLEEFRLGRRPVVLGTLPLVDGALKARLLDLRESPGTISFWNAAVTQVGKQACLEAIVVCKGSCSRLWHPTVSTGTLSKQGPEKLLFVNAALT